ncbi:hypothetical protein RZS08_07895, partial [Arthrospira platensis SPKY1]|nr:hypothetical protein [Arthrospira platensis SPKY1]
MTYTYKADKKRLLQIRHRLDAQQLQQNMDFMPVLMGNASEQNWNQLYQQRFIQTGQEFLHMHRFKKGWRWEQVVGLSGSYSDFDLQIAREGSFPLVRTQSGQAYGRSLLERKHKRTLLQSSLGLYAQFFDMEQTRSQGLFLLPSLWFEYTGEKGHQTQLSVSRSLQDPSFGQLVGL